MTSFQDLGLSVNVSDPLVWSRRASYDPLTKWITAYSHKLSAFLGYDEAKISSGVSAYSAGDWIEHGLGRHIEVANPDLDQVIEVFVNKIEISYGSLSVLVGPLLEIVNRASCVYAPLDTSTDPPTVGARTLTTVADNTISQAKYGIVETILSVGQTIQADAEQARDTFLAENAWPKVSKTIGLGNLQNLTLQLTLHCLGYGHWLEAFIYNEAAGSGTTTLTAKLEDVLGTDPNGLISTDYGNIQANALLAPSYENDDPSGMAVAEEIVSLGDANDARWLFGVYAGRKAVYEPAPTTIAYRQSLADRAQRIYTMGDRLVQPWDVKPGKWLYLTDFLPGQGVPTDLRTDPRMVFIESLNYTAPFGLTINESKIGTIDQKLAKIGLDGLYL